MSIIVIVMSVDLSCRHRFIWAIILIVGCIVIVFVLIAYNLAPSGVISTDAQLENVVPMTSSVTT